LHEALFRHPERVRAVVNLGGIANVTVLVPGRPVSGFDTGPANCYLDLWYRRHHDQGRYDAGGRWAASGRVDQEWLQILMDEPFFDLPAPKSTGIEYFSPGWLQERLPSWAHERPADVQATLAECSARSIAEALMRHGDDAPDEILLCGGGTANVDLRERLSRHIESVQIETSDAFGLSADHVESTLFAWLARKRLENEHIDSASVTGARSPVLMGVVFAAPAN
jgi:anhydro-N-acetylmuramic acid kinase